MALNGLIRILLFFDDFISLKIRSIAVSSLKKTMKLPQWN